MKNKLVDLNEHLFESLERIGDQALSGEALAQEIARGKAISDLAGQAIGVAKVSLETLKAAREMGLRHAELPAQLQLTHKRD